MSDSLKRRTKTEFARNYALANEISISQAEGEVNRFITAVTKDLGLGFEIVLTGFGKFSVAERAEREGINPITKQPMKIKASKLAHFKSGEELKAVLNPNR